MTLPSAGQPISFSDIRTEFDSIPSGSISINDLYRSGTHIRDRHGINNNIPTSGQISLSNFAGLYLEGSALQKLQNFRTYRASGTITKGTQQGEVVVTHTGNLHVTTLTTGISLTTLFTTHKIRLNGGLRANGLRLWVLQGCPGVHLELTQ